VTKGKAKMSASAKRTLSSPAAFARRLASAIDAAEMSTEVNWAPGLFWARMTVWAPTPQPASRTELPSG
jgi:hypothetical protein